MINIKQIQSFKLTVMRIAGFLEYLQQFVKLVRAYAYTEGSAQCHSQGMGALQREQLGA